MPGPTTSNRISFFCLLMFVVYLFWVTFSVNSAGGRDLWSKASSHQEEGFNGRERKDRKLSVYELSAC